MKKAVLIVSGVIVVATLIGLNIRSTKGKKTDVQVAEVIRRDLTKVITASGNIQPKRQLNISASAIGKVTRLAVKEGDTVEKGDFLLEIDPLPYKTVVDLWRAAVRGAAASLELEQASFRKARLDHVKAVDLKDKGFSSDDELQVAIVNFEVAQARVKSARELLKQQKANLEKAQHDLDEVSISADMSGIITSLNVEKGESAIMGTLNNPGTVLLTIADLSEMEAEVKVDETEIVSIAVGQVAAVNLDAYPDTTFAGIVSEVGNSAIRANLGMGQQSVDFKVVITITDQIPNIRPGLSASVDIMVADAKQVLTVPIQCLTIRDAGDITDNAESAAVVGNTSTEKSDIEGVLIVEAGVVRFQKVIVGIAGESHFEVRSGIADGDVVVTGPLKAINDLRDGDRVKVDKSHEKDRKD